MYLEIPIRRVLCRVCGTVKRESLDFLSDNPFYTKRFSYYVGRRCRASSIKDIAKELHLDWHTVKELEKQYMREQLRRTGTPGPKIIGIDEVSIRKGHTSRAVDEWAHRSGVKLDFIRPGKPIENAYIENFNGRLRQECLNQCWFSSLEDAKIKIEACRTNSNEHRPHTSLGNQTPEQFESEWRLSRTAKEGFF